MKDLIKALQIFDKYYLEELYSPTHCEHDTFMVCNIELELVSRRDIELLAELSFTWDEEFDCFSSFRFGSC